MAVYTGILSSSQFDLYQHRNARWDLKMGQRGLLDRLLVAHTTPVTSIAWRESPGRSGSETGDNGMGWFASGGLDRCVKVNTLKPSR